MNPPNKNSPICGDIISIDISGYGGDQDYSDLLMFKRNLLCQAIERTSYFEIINQDHSLVQYRGDEFIIAFENGQTTNDAANFANEIFVNLQKINAPFQIKAGLVHGMFEKGKIFECNYLYGEAVDELNKLVKGARKGHLISNINFDGAEPIDEHKFLSSSKWERESTNTSKRSISKIRKSSASDHGHFVVALNLNKGKDNFFSQHLLGLLAIIKAVVEKSILEQFSISISPTGALIAIRENSFKKTFEFLKALRNIVEAQEQAMEISVAVTHDNLGIKHIEWLGTIFEGKPAINVSRIGIELKSFELGVSKKTHENFFKVAPPIFGKGQPDTVAPKNNEEPLEIFRFSECFGHPPQQNADPTSSARPSDALNNQMVQFGTHLPQNNKTTDLKISEEKPTVYYENAVFKRLGDFPKICRQFIDQIIGQISSPEDQWRMEAFLSVKFEEVYSLHEKIKNDALSYQHGILKDIDMVDDVRMDTAIKAIKIAKKTIYAISNVEIDNFIEDKRYLDANLDAKDPQKGGNADLDVRRMVIRHKNKPFTSNFKKAFNDQRAVRIDIRWFYPDEFRYYAKQTWHQIPNVLIIDGTMMTKSDSKPGSHSGVAVVYPDTVNSSQKHFLKIWDGLKDIEGRNELL